MSTLRPLLPTVLARLPSERVCPRRGQELLRLSPHVSSLWRALTAFEVKLD